MHRRQGAKGETIARRIAVEFVAVLSEVGGECTELGEHGDYLPPADEDVIGDDLTSATTSHHSGAFDRLRPSRLLRYGR